MVHSGSASPMTTTPSASPHLTVVAAPPSLQAAPLVPHPGDTTDPDLTRTPAKFHSTDLTFNSDLTQPCTLTPANAEPPVGVPAKALDANSSPASSWLSAPTPTPAPGPVNGRTSGRKRTPKACDCCGPKGTGHNARTSGRGRGRARGRGASSGLSDTPKRKARGQLTQNKSFDLTMEKVDDTEVGDDRNEKMRVTETHLMVANTQSQMRVSLPVSASVQGVPMTSSAASVKGDALNKEGVSVEGSVVTGETRGVSDDDVDMRSLGLTDRGATVVRGREGVQSASKTEVDGGVKRRGLVGLVNNSKAYSLPQLVFVRGQGPNSNAEVDHGEHADPSLVRSPFENGDTVNLSDTEPEEEANGDNIMMTEMENGLPSFSHHSGPASESCSSQDLDSEMQVDQTSDKTNSMSVSVILSNGSATTAMNEACATFMEVETSHSAVVTPPCQGPITISLMQRCWALRDHRLYCQPGTWETENETEEVLGINGKTQGEDESMEQLIDLIHEFLESFYMKYGGFIPLSEKDVLEYLKKKGNPDLSNRGVDIKREMTRYRAGLASAPIAGFMVTYNRHTLSLEDLGTLEEQNWLNDQIINMYGELIMEATQQKVHFFNSFFHKQLVAKGYDGVKRWTKKVDLFSKWLLLIPIHLEIHWALVTVTMATKTISYYDSQGIVFRHTTDNIMKYLLSEAREKKQTAFQKGWKITIIKGIPQQKNDSDCGVFVLEYCRRLSVRQPLLFSQEDMPSIRKRIYKELCECRLND